MPKITYLEIENYRSIKDSIRINFPTKQPLVLVGENNSGKSNIVRALNLVLGEVWPGSHMPEQHEFWGRTPANGEIHIEVGLDGISKGPGADMPDISKVYWACGKINFKPDYQAIPKSGMSIGVTEYIRDQCAVVVIGSERNLSQQLSYANRNTFLSKLSRKFHARLTEDESRTKRLGEKFKELMAIFDEVDEFESFRDELKDSFDEMIAGFTHQLGIDFSAYDPRNYFHSLSVIPLDGKEERTFEELGTGEEQVLAFAFAQAYAKAFHGGVVLVVEEPESHLHPLAQQWLANNIRKMAEDELQVITTTHSPYFVNLLGLPGLALVTKVDGATKIKQLTADELAKYCIEHQARQDRTTPDTILPFYAGSSTYEIMSGLFSKKIVLVEGQTEQFALPEYLLRAGLDVNKEGVNVIPVIGKGNLAKWWRFFSAYQIPTYVIFDNDDEDDKKATKRTDILKTLGALDDEILPLLASDDWLITDRFSVFGVDFEETVRKHFAKYSELEAEAQDYFGNSKPLIARFVALKLTQNEKDTGWAKFAELKSKIESLK